MAVATNRTLSAVATAFTVLYVAWIAFSLGRNVPPLAQTLNALGVNLSFPVRTALSLCSPPLLWGIAAFLIAALVLKELLIPSLSTRVLVSLIVFMGTALASALITEVLYAPLLDIVHRIG